jgi:hypothetical protein
VKTTVVLPIGKVAGALLVKVNAAEAVQLSVAVGLIKATAAKVALQAAPALTVLFAGQEVMIGSTFSLIVINWVQVDELPFASVTVKITVVFPIGKIAGALFILTKAATAVQLSVAVGLTNGTVAKGALQVVGFAETVIFTGQEIIVGGTFSIIVTIC